jgi:hypothetical protein
MNDKFDLRAPKVLMIRRRGFEKRERRVFCPCELCRLRFGRLLYPLFRSGQPLGFGRLRGFAGNFPRVTVRRLP